MLELNVRAKWKSQTAAHLRKCGRESRSITEVGKWRTPSRPARMQSECGFALNCEDQVIKLNAREPE